MICLFVSFQVKSESDEEIYENFKKNEKEFHETLISNSEMLFEGGFDKTEVKHWVIEKLGFGVIFENNIKLKKNYSDSQEKKIINIVTEKIFQEPK